MKETRLLRGNGKRAIWRDVTVADGAIYRLPNGELVRASGPDEAEFEASVELASRAWRRLAG